MQIRCHVCDYSREVDVTKIPPTAEFATCPKCKHRFRFRAVDIDAIEPGEASTPKRDEKHGDVWDAVDSLHEQWREQGIVNEGREDERNRQTYGPAGAPWENQESIGLVQSFTRTTFWALLQPSTFFANMTSSPRLLLALIYHIILGVFQFVLSVVWARIMAEYLRDMMVARIGEEHYIRIIQQGTDLSTLPSTLLFVPFMLAMQVLITSAIIYVSIRLLAPGRAAFPKAFKVVCYAGAGYALTILPIVGFIVGPIYYLVLLFIGCRSSFGLSRGKTLTVMIPLYALMFFSAMLQSAQFMG